MSVITTFGKGEPIRHFASPSESGQVRLECKPIGGGDQCVKDAGFGECVPGRGCDPEFGLRPGLMQLVRGNRRSREVIATLDDDGWNPGQSADVRDQLTLGEPAAMEKVVVLDPGEG